MKEEAELLLSRLEVAFSKVSGPPAVTISAAKVLDDWRNPDAVEREREGFWASWKDVEDVEMENFDGWSYLDATSFQFYLPAFIRKHLLAVLVSKEPSVLDPGWMPTISLMRDETIDGLTEEQRVLVADYLWFLESSITDQWVLRELRQNRQTWEKRCRQ